MSLEHPLQKELITLVSNYDSWYIYYD